MPITHPEPVRNSWADQMMTSLNGGKIRVFDAASVLLLEYTLPNPLAPAASGGTATANPITTVAALASGVATRFEALTSANVLRTQGDVGIAGGGAALTLSTLSVLLNQPVPLNSFTYRAFP